VVQDAHIAGYDLVLQNGAGRDIDTVAMVGNDDDSALVKLESKISIQKEQSKEI